MAVTPGTIVKDFDVIEDVGTSQISGFVDAFANSFLLQAAEEGLRYGIVPAVSTTTHARLQVVRLTESLPVITSVLGEFNWSSQH